MERLKSFFTRGSGSWLLPIVLIIVDLILVHKFVAIENPASLRYLIAYYISDLVLFVAVVMLLVASMNASKTGKKITTTACLSWATFLFIVIIFDLFILTFRFDTSGPGGNFVPHRNWLSRVAFNNKDGYWERDLLPWQQGRPNQLVIASVGRSWLWGQGLLHRNERFSYLLEEKLKAAGTDAVVLNFAMKDGIEAIKHDVAKVHPDIVLLAYTAGDIPVANFIDTAPLFSSSTIINLSDINPTLNFIIWKFYGPSSYRLAGMGISVNRVLAYREPGTFGRFMDYFAKMRDETQAIGASPVVVILPYPHMWAPFLPEVRASALETLRIGLKQLQIPFIDLTDIEQEFTLDSFEINSMDSHPNSKVQIRIADRLFDELNHLITDRKVSISHKKAFP